MKKAFMLAGLVLCTTVGFAEEIHLDAAAAEGKKRNEEAFERSLEQTGWKNGTTDQSKKSTTDESHDHPAQMSRPKNS